MDALTCTIAATPTLARLLGKGASAAEAEDAECAIRSAVLGSNHDAAAQLANFARREARVFNSQRDLSSPTSRWSCAVCMAGNEEHSVGSSTQAHCTTCGAQRS